MRSGHLSAPRKNTTQEQEAQGLGDIWTWTAICADTKLIPSWYIGERDSEAAMTFMGYLAKRLASTPPPAPNSAAIATGYAEQSNITMQMQCRRFTRLTNAFFQEGREPCSRRGASHDVLQLRSYS